MKSSTNKLAGIIFILVFTFYLTVSFSCAQTGKGYYEKGIEYGTQGKFEEAEKEFKKALEVDKFDYSTRFCLKTIEAVSNKEIEEKTAIYMFKGAVFENKEMFDEAVAEYKKVIATNPNYAYVHTNLGLVYDVKGMLNKAIAEHKKALTINPNLTEAHNNLGRSYLFKGNYDEAIAEFKKAITLDPVNTYAYSNLGVAYYQKGMLDNAITELKNSLVINPSFAEVHYNLALIYYENGRYDLAIEHCDKAMELGYQAHPDFLKDLKPYRR